LVGGTTYHCGFRLGVNDYCRYWYFRYCFPVGVGKSVRATVVDSRHGCGHVFGGPVAVGVAGDFPRVAYCPEPVRVPDPIFPTGCDLERECRIITLAMWMVGQSAIYQYESGRIMWALTIILQKSSPLQVAAAAVGAFGMWVIFRRKIKQQGMG
jgi:hypothetical protein